MPSATFRWTTVNVQWTDTQIVAEIPYPYDLPLPHAFAGMVVEWASSDIPSHLLDEYMNPYPSLKRRYYASFVSGEGTDMNVVVLAIEDGSIVDYWVATFPSTMNIRPAEWWANPSKFAVTPLLVGPRIGQYLPSNTGWIANAFSFITFQTLDGVVQPIVWVGFFYVKEMTMVSVSSTDTNVRLCLCGIPVRAAGGNPIFLSIKPNAELIETEMMWSTYPIASLGTALFFPAWEVEAGAPEPVQHIIREPSGSVRFFSVMVGVSASGGYVPIVEEWGLWNTLMPVCYSPSRVFSGFYPVAGSPYNNFVYVVSPFTGIHAVYPRGATNFSLRSGSEDILIPPPRLLGGCMDNYNLYGGDTRLAYFSTVPNLRARSPVVIAYTVVEEETSTTTFQRAAIDSSIAEAFTLSSLVETVEWKQFIKPPLQVWSLEDKGYIVWENKAKRVDFITKVNSDDVLIGGSATSHMQPALLHPCAPSIPLYMVAAIPFYYGYTYPSGRERDDIESCSVGRMSQPFVIPQTGKAVYAIFTPAMILPTVDKPVERNAPVGVLYIMEKQEVISPTFPIEPLDVTQKPNGEIVITFSAPITGTHRVGFIVHNPPFPSYSITQPSAHIIADSISDFWGWEQEVETGVWQILRGPIQKVDSSSPPFRIRVTVLPQHSNYVRVIAYKV